MSKEKLLTLSQMKVKKPRVVNYSNDIYKQQYRRDIITLYVACGLDLDIALFVIFWDLEMIN